MVGVFLLINNLYICFIMINDYLRTKQLTKELQILKAWKQFYVECNNEFKAMKLDYKILRLESKNFE